MIKELAWPAIIKACVSCGSDRHRPSGRFRVNANGPLLDVWMLIWCERCGRTSKIPIHERVHVRTLRGRRLLNFENNDTATVRHLTMDASLAARSAHQLDWTGTWELETDMPFYELGAGEPALRSGEPAPLLGAGEPAPLLGAGEPAPLEVVVRFELPAPIRIERLLMAGFGLSRSAVRIGVGSGRLRIPVSLGAKVHEDFTLYVRP